MATILPRGSNALVTSQNREEIAAYLRRVADKLEQGAGITLTSGSEPVTMEPPARPTFEVKAEREGPTDTPGEWGIEFELEWDESDDGLLMEYLQVTTVGRTRIVPIGGTIRETIERQVRWTQILR